MREKPRCHKRQVVAKSRLFTVESLDLTFSNGEQRVYERIRSHGHGAVLIVPLTQAGSLLLVREYAAGTDRYELAFPKGLVNPAEDILNAANRELQEEVGFAAKRLDVIRDLTLAPGYFGARLEIVLARDLYASVLPGDEPEPPEVVEWPLHEMETLLEQPDFTEARSIASLFLVNAWLEKEKQ